MKKKLLVLMMAAMMSLSAVACSSSSPSDNFQGEVQTDITNFLPVLSGVPSVAG